MVLTKAGIEDGIFYLFDDPDKYGGYMMIFNVICCWLSGIIGILIFICHFGRLLYIYKVSKIQDNVVKNTVNIEDIFPLKNKKRKLGILYHYIWIHHILTILALIFGFSHNITGQIYQILYISNLVLTCKSFQPMSNTLWNLIKFCVYFISMLRVFKAFNGSAFDYSKKAKIFLSLYSVLVTGFGLFHMTYFTYTYDIKENGVFKWCQMGMDLVSLIIAMILEVTLNTVLLILFIRPAIQLSKTGQHKPAS